MAITKIHAIKSTLGKALAYIENPDKTDGQMLVSGYNCEPQTASIDFEMTAVLAHKARNLKRKRSTNLAYHLIQSFSPEDAVTPEQAHELGKKLAFEYTGGKYEYVVATHIDKGHIHNHIMINAVSFYDYKKLRTVPYRTARQIRDISDRLCMEAHLSVIDDPQKIGQLYPENAGKKKSVSNRTEIRKRLNFCLERATDYSQFLSMAKELEITPTIRGKHISYLLEGAGRAVRDNSLSDTDTFTYAGICARLSDNAQEQKYLRKTITGILSTATGMADFADKLKTAGIETKVKKATGQVLYRATVLDGTWVPEDALGSEFTSEGIEYALKNGKMQIAEDAEITLIDRYQELTIQYPEVCTAAVKLSSRQILSAGKNGLVLQVHDDNGNHAKLMVNKSEVTTSPDGEITFNVGNDFSYDLVYEDGTHGTIRGTKLIQQIDEENNVLPLAVVLTEDQIKTMSLRGVTIALPSKGIERLFIPEKYVVCNAANGQCAVSLYQNHQYSYIPTGGENKRNSIQGDQLAAILGVAINPSTKNTTLSRRIAAVERRMGIENAKNLGKVLLGMTSENMYTAADYDKAILSLGKKQIDLMRQRPILENGILYAFVRDTYIWYAIDASTGQLIWRGNANTDESLFVCGDVRPVIANGKLWCIDAQNTRPAYLSLDTGELAWTSTLEKVSSRGMTTNGSTVFYSSNSGRQITAFDAETNQVVWQKDLRYDNKDRDLQEMQIDSALVYNGNSLIHVAERGRITALNPDSGEILWCIDAAGYPERVFWSTPEATDGLVIATGIDGKVYAVEYTH